MVRNIIIMFCIGFFIGIGCVSSMPSAKPPLTIGKEVPAPAGYINWKHREKGKTND